MDAFNTGLGAILMQVILGEEHPIMYLSQNLSFTEQKYSIIERKALTLKWAVETLQFYLTNNPFMLITDHAPLQWLHKVKDSNPRVLRSYLSLLPFSFQIQHFKGTANGNADYLSCLPSGELEIQSVCVVTSQSPHALLTHQICGEALQLPTSCLATSRPTGKWGFPRPSPRRPAILISGKKSQPRNSHPSESQTAGR